MRAVLTDVEPPSFLAWTDLDNNMATSVSFADAADGATEITILQRQVSEAVRSPEATAGFQSSLDRFERYLQRLRSKD